MTKIETRNPTSSDLGHSRGPGYTEWQSLEEINRQSNQHFPQEEFKQSIAKIATRQNRLESRLNESHTVFEDRLKELENQVVDDTESEIRKSAQKAVVLPIYKATMLTGAGIAIFGILISLIYQSLLLGLPMLVSTVFLIYAYKNPQFIE